MTGLVQDAICTETADVLARNLFASARINPEVLQEILKDLDNDEVISIIFLMVDKDSNYARVIADIKEDPRTAFTRLTNRDAWTNKLLESLVVIKNKYILEKMAFNQTEIQELQKFVTNEHNVSPYLNKAVKSLYFLCKHLDDNEVIRLVKNVNSKLSEPIDIDYKLCLELYILEWLNQKYISIDPDDCELSSLLKNLKSIGCSDLPFNFDYWGNCNSFSNKNEQDSQAHPPNFNNQSTSQCFSSENSLVSNDSDLMWSFPGHKKLCFVINQINFKDKIKYESRKGSEIDERSLRETFEGCGFTVIVYHDYTKQDMTNLLDSLNTELYSVYGAIFICILSHGFRGEIVFADANTLSIATIREKFCCNKLGKVFKFLILQSCQGKQIGMVEGPEEHLVSDGPCPWVQLHFCVFQATISDYAAMRHKKEGSWFIQDLCREIRDANKPIEIKDLIQKVKKRLSERKVLYKNQFAVQVAESSDTIIVSYELPKFERKNIKSEKYN